MSTHDPETDGERFRAVMDSRPEYRDLFHLIHRDPERAWTVLLQLIAEVPDDLLEYAGAADLETFVRRQAAAFGDRIVAQAHRDERFREALSCIWLSDGVIPAGVQRRLLGVTGGRILILSPDDGDEDGG